MTEQNQKKLGAVLWSIADTLRGAMNADDFRDYMLAFLFLRYLSDNYEAAAQKELGAEYPESIDSSVSTPLQLSQEACWRLREKVECIWDCLAGMRND